jgi:hypothetical protein
VEWASAVDVETPARHEDTFQPLQCERSGVGITAVEGPDPHGQGDVVALLAGRELELLGSDLTDRQPTLLDEVVSGRPELRDRLGRPVDGQDVTAWLNTDGDFAGGRARAATDLDNPEPGPQRQRVEDRSQSGVTTRAPARP